MESMNQMLVECVKAAGGSATVGIKLWPEKTREAAQRLLLDCLNDDRSAKLSPEQVVLILRLARERGFHGGINYLLEHLSYAPTTPVAVKDEAEELMRMVVEGQRHLAEQLDRLTRLSPKLRAAA